MSATWRNSLTHVHWHTQTDRHTHTHTRTHTHTQTYTRYKALKCVSFKSFPQHCIQLTVVWYKCILIHMYTYTYTYCNILCTNSTLVVGALGCVICKPSPLGGFLYTIMLPHPEPWVKRLCTRCFEGGPLTHGSWWGNIVNKKPPRGGGFLWWTWINTCSIHDHNFARNRFSIKLSLCPTFGFDVLGTQRVDNNNSCGRWLREKVFSGVSEQLLQHWQQWCLPAARLHSWPRPYPTTTTRVHHLSSR